MSRSTLCLLLLLPFLAHSQITAVATNDDASVVYFLANFNLAGAAQPTSSAKIYVHDSAGLRLYSDIFPNFPNRPTLQWETSSSSSISSPWVSGDGLIVAYNGTYSATALAAPGLFACDHSRVCTETVVDTVVQNGPSQTILVNSILSANGRYAFSDPGTLIDLTSGKQTSVPASVTVGSRDAVASGGTVLFSDPFEPLLYLWNPTQGLTQIPAGSVANPQAIMDDAATTIIFPSGAALYRYDIATQTTHLFANGSAPSISRDGKWAVFLSPVNGIQQAWAARTDGTEFEQLTDEPVNVTTSVISGNGDFAIVVTGANAIWKLDWSAAPPRTPHRFAGRRKVQILPPTPAPNFQGPWVQGSLSTVTVSGLVPTTVTAVPPLPLNLAGYQILLNGTPAPILSISPTQLLFQMPWETPATETTLQLVSPAPRSPLGTAPESGFVSSFSPQFVLQPITNPQGLVNWYLVATHADSTPVTSDNPARASEMISISALGLGAVSPPVATGAISPSNPPAVVQQFPACQLVDGYNGSIGFGDLRLVRMELTPGTIGTYRITIQLPSAISQNAIDMVTCANQPNQPDFYTSGLLPVAPSLSANK